MFAHASRLLFPLLAACLPAISASAQCLTWDDGYGVGASDDVRVLATLDDGSGPHLYAGGAFQSIGGTAAANVARRSGTSWSALGTGPGIDVYALAVFDGGSGPELYAGGGFRWAVYRWSGSAWSAVGTGLWGSDFSFGVNAMVVHDDGSGPALYVAGAFKNARNTPVNNVARWNGSNWSAVGWLPEGVADLAVFDDGSGPKLYAAGTISPFAGGPAAWISKWDGVGWSAIASFSPGTGTGIGALAVHDDGAGTALYVGGGFPSISGVAASSVAKWDGAAWSALGTGVVGAVTSFTVFDDGNSGPALYVGGQFTSAGGSSADNVARWDGTSWSALGSGTNGVVFALAVADDAQDADLDLFAGGAFTLAGGNASTRIALWHGCATQSACFGDGSAGACPCANSGAIGHGCENSATTGGAVLTIHGTAVPDTAVLTSSGELANSLSIFLQGDQLLGSPVTFGDGLRCTGGNLKRLYAKNASGGTVSAPDAFDPSITARSAILGEAIAPGSERFYQVYYRDPELAFCPGPQGGAFNASNALRVRW